MPDNNPMQRALAEALRCGEAGEVPVGAVVVDSKGEIISACGNAMRATQDPTAHAEMRAIRLATERCGSPYLTECDLYVTLEPCTMCAGAISLARIRRLYYGTQDKKGGAVDNGINFFAQATCHHRPEVYGGIEESKAQALLTQFFQEKR